MSLFQLSVVSKYLKTLDKQTIQTAYASFKTHFHNATIQENIRNSKEEQYQEGFLSHLFVNVLGYTLNPAPNFNLTTEHKNVKDSKKADGAIIFANKVKAVIELKGTNTTDLGNVEVQAFSYKNNQPECVYVITSNFEKLRFYIDNAIEFIEFNLFTLTESEFEMLYLCLALQSIEKGIPKKIKEESISHEDEITKKLYRDYSLFKRELHTDLVAQNPQYDALTLFKKSQKLLDRFLFLFFAEDRQLLPPNSVRLILNDWRELQERDVEIPLYDRFKKYFEYLNTGYKGKRYDVFAYNGGLFKPDDILDMVTIDDELLYRHTAKISEYDFASEVDVNILGHIFENSLNELDELKAELTGNVVDKSKSKRKKDGIFYTPKYITKYIVDNTVGRLCTDKKAELGIVEEDYFTDRKRNKTTKQPLADKLTKYREWLLQITICDPACGSGAFLNQALNFLIDEHAYIDELQAKLFGDALVLSNIENTILENNLFGVDLNEESVEIAKLSLWLRTAHPNRKLNDLNNNIKCGNSLIDDPAIAGDKAFDWGKEFPQVFGRDNAINEPVIIRKEETPDYLKLVQYKLMASQLKAEQALELSKEAIEISKEAYEYSQKLEVVSAPKVKYGKQNLGFDIIIANPPYVDNRGFDKKVLAHLNEKYIHSFRKSGTETFKTTKLNLIAPFIELNNKILKSNGLTSYIFHKNIFKTNGYTSIREYILNNFDVLRLVDWGPGQFQDVIAETATFVLRKSTIQDDSIIVDFFNLSDKISEEIRYQSDFLKSYEYIFGINVNKSDREIILRIEKNSFDLENFVKINNGIVTGNDSEYLSYSPLNQNYKKTLRGKDIKRYSSLAEKEYVKYEKDKLLRSRDENIFLSDEKLIMQMINIEFVLTYDDQQFYNLGTTYAITNSNNSQIQIKYLLVVLNSKLISYYYKKKFTNESGLTNAISTQNLFKIPIKEIKDFDQLPFITKADQMLSLNKEFQEASGKFQRNLIREFSLDTLSTKLQNWHTLSYADFIKELEKFKVKLSLHQKAEWESYFNQQAEQTRTIKAKIDSTDCEIDRMVYLLYDLTEEEIRIVEES